MVHARLRGRDRDSKEHVDKIRLGDELRFRRATKSEVPATKSAGQVAVQTIRADLKDNMRAARCRLHPVLLDEAIGRNGLSR